MEELTAPVIDKIAALARNGMGPQVVTGGNIPYVLVPDGYTAKPMPELVFNEQATKAAAAPERIKGNIGVLNAPSFVEYYNLFSDDNSRTFADESKIQVVSVLDYHGAKEGGPRWGLHRLTLTLRQSEEWKAWAGHNNKQFTQTAFAEFLEQNSLDIIKPVPAAMMDIANDLHATTEVEFGSGIRQQDGQVKFKYTETTKTTVGADQITVPDRFTIQIPAFVGGDRVAMDALLRFRVNQGKLSFWYTLVRPDEVVRNAFIACRNGIAKELGIVIIDGTPA